MRQIDLRVQKLGVKLIALTGLAFLVVTFAPESAHHLLLVIAAVLFFIGLGALLKHKEQAGWLEKKAKITSIRECEEEVPVSQYYRIKHYYPQINYEYSGNGEMYSGNVVSFEKENIWVPEITSWGDPTPTEKRWWLKLRPGEEIPVYVNPRNEAEAVLVKGASKVRRSHHSALVVAGVLICAVWAVLAFSNLTSHSSSPLRGWDGHKVAAP